MNLFDSLSDGLESDLRSGMRRKKATEVDHIHDLPQDLGGEQNIATVAQDVWVA